jgi:hypothetical protein
MTEAVSEWSDRLRLLLEDLVDEFVRKGVDHHDVLDALTVEVAGLRETLDHDPDPVEDANDSEAVSEPANDWPAA